MDEKALADALLRVSKDPLWRERLSALRRLKRRERLEDSFLDFLIEAWPYLDQSAPYKHNWHIESICDHVEAVVRGEITRLGINVPPRSGKSNILSVAFPAWVWAQSRIGPISGPQVQFMFASYSQSVAEGFSVATLRLIQSPWYQELWGDRFKLLSENMRQFENDKGGKRLATSTTGGGTGLGGIVLVVDDSLNAEDANSQLEREKVIRWWTETMPTRLNDQIYGVKIVIAQRLHADDICGYIMGTSERWDWLVIPMRYEPGYASVRTTSLGWSDPRSEDGELLWEERWPLSVVQQLETDLGPWAAASQLQQVPVPRGGGIILEDWWQDYNPDSAREECGVAPMANGGLGFPPVSYVLVSIDTAYKEDEANDWNACTVWGVWHNSKGWPRAIMMEAWRWRGPLLGVRLEGQSRIEFEAKARRPGDFPKEWGLTERVLDTARRRRADMILIEDKSRGVDLGNEIRRLLRPGEMQVRLEIPLGDKVSRLNSTVPLFADKMIWAPLDRAWATMVVSEVAQVPKGRWDDLCLVAGTMIATRQGLRAIETIRPGDQALTPEGWRLVSAAGFTGIRPVIERLGVVGTGNHPVFTLDSGWAELDTVSQASRLGRLSLCGLIQTIRRLRSSSTGSHTASWAAGGNTTSPRLHSNETVRTPRGCTSRSGKTRMVERCRRCMRSTIGMATLSIAALTIWSAYRKACTAACLRNAIKNVIAKCWLPLGTRLLLGTDPLRAANGIGRLAPSFWIEREQQRLGWLQRKAESAHGAGQPLPSRTGGNSTVQPSVSSNSQPGSEASASLPIPTMRPVFNLTVEGARCYYANGVLVHNCDTASQALIWLRTNHLVRLGSEADEEASTLGIFKSQAAPLYDV